MNTMRYLIPLIFLILATNVVALGLGPVQHYIIHEPGHEEEIELTVFNNEAKDLELVVRASGPLKDHLTYPDEMAFTPKEKQKKLYFTLTHPDVLSPGAHYTDLIVSERATGDSMIVAAQSHVSKLRLQVPNTEPYAAAKLIADMKRAEVSIYNFYIGPIETYVIFEIYKNSELVEKIRTEDLDIESMTESIHSIELNLEEGIYEVRAFVHYEGRIIELSEELTVGRKYVGISSILVDTFEPGEIARIDISLKNHWVLELPARVEVVIAKDILKTESVTIFDTAELSVFWETAGMEPGVYPALATVVYEGEASIAEFSVTVPEEPDNYWPIIGMIAAFKILLMCAYLIYRGHFRHVFWRTGKSRKK